MPPCPGIRLEKSLTLNVLLIDENTKSPSCPTIAKNNVVSINIAKVVFHVAV